MRVYNTSYALQEVLSEKRLKNKTIGFVPTMGALHQGHAALVEKSILENDFTVVSIFVNPRQFNQQEDFEKYPITIEQDYKLLEKIQCDFVFVPEYHEVFTDESTLKIDLQGLDKVLEGEHRPGHFQGVIDVVYKLFEVVKPTKAYFGKKDYQQLLVIKQMVNAINLPIEIVACPIVRDPDGLAKSSRNMRLNDKERLAALLISQTLFYAKQHAANYTIIDLKAFVFDALNNSPLLKPEYVEICNVKSLKPCTDSDKAQGNILLIAVWCGKVRLIDNIILEH
jgi:pantoate--beta-alanine ligase